MLRIDKETKIFVSCPAYFATGGTELLHQLVSNLKNIGYEAYMYYTPNNYAQPIHPAFTLYNNPFVREIEDNENDILIIPEVFNRKSIKKLNNLKCVQKVIWWLSVDNFFYCYSQTKISQRFLIYLLRCINKLMGYSRFDIRKTASLLNNRFKVNQEKFLLSAQSHFVQSQYAYGTLLKIGIPQNKIFYLSDYLNDDFLKITINHSIKEDIVLYNPAKGYSFTKKVIDKASKSGLKFVALQNMSRDEVKALLCEAKVYIDFGNHPGKDRMPREAAMAGCCIITGKRGSAKNKYDLPIDNKYKFDDDASNITDIIECIRICLKDYPNRILEFESYRCVILNEKPKFINDLKQIFGNTYMMDK